LSTRRSRTSVAPLCRAQLESSLQGNPPAGSACSLFRCSLLCTRPARGITNGGTHQLPVHTDDSALSMRVQMWSMLLAGVFSFHPAPTGDAAAPDDGGGAALFVLREGTDAHHSAPDHDWLLTTSLPTPPPRLAAGSVDESRCGDTGDGGRPRGGCWRSTRGATVRLAV
jgi:hypothetical protein